MISTAIRDEALLMLEGKGTILDVARTISIALNTNHIEAAVIGGVAVVLHLHIRTTRDVDVCVAGPLTDVADCLLQAGSTFDPSKREFILNDVPVHLVTTEQTGFVPKDTIEIEQIRTVSLADLISLKLSSGTTSVLRSQDVADVIGLIRANHLSESFTAKIAKAFRKEFKSLLKAIAGEGRDNQIYAVGRVAANGSGRYARKRDRNRRSITSAPKNPTSTR